MRLPEAELAADNAPHVARGRTLIVGFGEPELVRALRGGSDETVALETDYGAFRRVRQASGMRAIYAPWISPATAGAFDAVVVRLPKETERLRMLLAVARGVVASGGWISVCGRNDAGIRSAARHMREVVAGEPEVVAYGRHSRLLRTQPSARKPFIPREWRTIGDAADEALRVVGFPGVFASGRVDPATSLLLETIDIPDGACVLDVGCGSGVIASTLARRGDVKVHAVDTDALAIVATRQTARANGTEDRISVWGSDVFSDVDEHGYTHIVSNPPFHAGVRTTTEVGRRLIGEAPQHLARGGELWIVANRFLDYRTPLDEAFGGHDVVAETGKYRVYRARR
ncbi:MAG TPA: class I SAM-dependent methyltransferase [Actinomycetota bacterium]|nr:class I SAM-dependent methyltransferase [Actinomycetota bacterium]